MYDYHHRRPLRPTPWTWTSSTITPSSLLPSSVRDSKSPTRSSEIETIKTKKDYEEEEKLELEKTRMFIDR